MASPRIVVHQLVGMEILHLFERYANLYVEVDG